MAKEQPTKKVDQVRPPSPSAPVIQAQLDGEAVAEGVKINFNALLYRDGIERALSSPTTGVMCPVLLVHGSLDRAYPVSVQFHDTAWKHISAGGTKVRLQVIQDGPHFLTVTHWSVFNPLLVNWIDESPG